MFWYLLSVLRLCLIGNSFLLFVFLNSYRITTSNITRQSRFQQRVFPVLKRVLNRLILWTVLLILLSCPLLYHKERTTCLKDLLKSQGCILLSKYWESTEHLLAWLLLLRYFLFSLFLFSFVEIICLEAWCSYRFWRTIGEIPSLNLPTVFEKSMRALLYDHMSSFYPTFNLPVRYDLWWFLAGLLPFLAFLLEPHLVLFVFQFYCFFLLLKKGVFSTQRWLVRTHTLITPRANVYATAVVCLGISSMCYLAQKYYAAEVFQFLFEGGVLCAYASLFETFKRRERDGSIDLEDFVEEDITVDELSEQLDQVQSNLNAGGVQSLQ